MARAVRFDAYGPVDVLEVVDVERPVPGPRQALVRVKAAAINLGESKTREGLMQDVWPTTFPSGQGSDLAGVVAEVGDGVRRVAAGDEVIGFSLNRASHAQLALVEEDNLVPRPANVGWEQAGAVFVAGTSGYAAVRAVSPREGDTVVIAAAAGGVGTIAVQLVRRQKARVIAIASRPRHRWLADHGAIPVSYGDGVLERVRELGPVDAFIDLHGDGYVELALQLGVAPERIDTLVEPTAVERHGVKFEGHAVAANADVLAELVGLMEAGELEIPVAATYPLNEVRAAYRHLESGHLLGKIVLTP